MPRTAVVTCLVALALLSAASAKGPVGVRLENAADHDVIMPAMGLGTAGYGRKVVAPGEYPECWSDGLPNIDGSVRGPNCSATVLTATRTFLEKGGRRIDNSDTYNNMHTIGQAMRESGVPRSDVFLVSKVASFLPMGYNETFAQVLFSLRAYNTTYLDLVLIHWPTVNDNSTDPVCNFGAGTYDAKACRLSTWKALLTLRDLGFIKAVGVSNFATNHLQEIIDAKMTLPAVNQCPYNPHLFAPQAELLAFCKKHKIVFNSYSPLGIPDFKKYPQSISTTGRIIEEPGIIAIGKAHNLTAAQVILAHQWSEGIVVNPRTANPEHMDENLDPLVLNLVLSEAERETLESFKANSCADDKWYECCGGSQPSIPSCGP